MFPLTVLTFLQCSNRGTCFVVIASVVVDDLVKSVAGPIHSCASYHAADHQRRARGFICFSVVDTPHEVNCLSFNPRSWHICQMLRAGTKCSVNPFSRISEVGDAIHINVA